MTYNRIKHKFKRKLTMHQIQCYIKQTEHNESLFALFNRILNFSTLGRDAKTERIGIAAAGFYHALHVTHQQHENTEGRLH